MLAPCPVVRSDHRSVGGGLQRRLFIQLLLIIFFLPFLMYFGFMGFESVFTLQDVQSDFTTCHRIAVVQIYFLLLNVPGSAGSVHPLNFMTRLTN